MIPTYYSQRSLTGYELRELHGKIQHPDDRHYPSHVGFAVAIATERFSTEHKYCYTVGLTALGYPEMVMMGQDAAAFAQCVIYTTMRHTLDELVDGHVFGLGSAEAAAKLKIRDLGDEGSLMVPDAIAYAAQTIPGVHPKVVQLVWNDDAGCFPDEVGYDPQVHPQVMGVMDRPSVQGNRKVFTLEEVDEGVIVTPTNLDPRAKLYQIDRITTNVSDSGKFTHTEPIYVLALDWTLVSTELSNLGLSCRVVGEVRKREDGAFLVPMHSNVFVQEGVGSALHQWLTEQIQ